MTADAKPPTFSDSFNKALTASDQDFAKYLQHAGRFLLFSHMLKDNVPVPSGSTAELEVMKAVQGDVPLVDMMARVNMIPVPADAVPSPNNTGIRLNVPMGRDGRSLAEAGLFSTTITEGMCVACSGPAAAKHNACKDLSDPAQVRGGQLGRMMIGLHEVGHNAFNSYVALYGGLPENERRDVFTDQRLSETMSDTMAALVMIKTLGREGLAFVKQYAAGFRDISNGHNHDHNTSNALGMLIETAESDLPSITNLSHQHILDASYRLTRMATPDSDQRRTIETALEKAGIDSSLESSGHSKAAARLEWYNAQRKDEQAGRPVSKEALDLYEKYMRSGDRAMMTPQQLQQNLQVMVDLGPLKNDALWQEQAQAAELSCRALPQGGLQQSITAPKPAP